MNRMDFFKATDGEQWYVSIDGGETFERCRKEPFLHDKIAAPIDEIAVNNPADDAQEEVSLSREQVEQRGLTISKITA